MRTIKPLKIKISAYDCKSSPININPEIFQANLLLDNKEVKLIHIELWESGFKIDTLGSEILPNGKKIKHSIFLGREDKMFDIELPLFKYNYSIFCAQISKTCLKICLTIE